VNLGRHFAVKGLGLAARETTAADGVQRMSQMYFEVRKQVEVAMEVGN
jgi:hypothetical protein